MIDGLAAQSTACKRSLLGFAFACTLATCIVIAAVCTVSTGWSYKIDIFSAEIH
jgi:hypothetical protein